MNTLLQRIMEPSSHAGVAALLQAAKAFFPQYGAVIDAATLFFGSLAVVVSEKGAQS